MILNAIFDSGNTTFMILCTSLVMLMTPGLAMFYGGLAGKRNILGIMMQTFVSLGITTVMWITFGYSLCFSGGEGGIIGNFDLDSSRNSLIRPYQKMTKLPYFYFLCLPKDVGNHTPPLLLGAFVNKFLLSHI
jgi:Amt family ammonium transporter